MTTTPFANNKAGWLGEAKQQEKDGQMREVPAAPTVRQVYRRQALMDSMIEVTLVNVPDAVRVDQGQAFFAARSNCRLCSHEQKCREWLATARPGRWSPDFCPNAQLFDACRTENVPVGP